jgi:hypothetical protein
VNNVISLDSFKRKNASIESSSRLSMTESSTSSLVDRIERIKSSIVRVNILMEELKRESRADSSTKKV